MPTIIFIQVIKGADLLLLRLCLSSIGYYLAQVARRKLCGFGHQARILSSMKRWLVIALSVLIIAGAFLAGWLWHQKTQSPAGTPSGAHVLSYANAGLSSVGADIYNQTNATQLDLSHNSLRSLPSQMGRMTHLQSLDVSYNNLQGSLIAEIRLMPLVTLNASHNDMTGMPAEVGQLRTLQTLDYSYNQVNTLPNELANLTQLKTLNLTGNPLSAVQIDGLKAKLPNTTVLF